MFMSSWPFIFVFAAAFAQYEYVNMQVACIIKKSVMAKKKQIEAVELSAAQSFLNKVFKL